MVPRDGLTYVYEAADDGSAYGGNANRGVTGVRGDVRIGGNRIDGDFGVLAYNFLHPTVATQVSMGDMVIDTADRFFRDVSNGPTGENRGLSNVARSRKPATVWDWATRCDQQHQIVGTQRFAVVLWYPT